MPHISWEQWGIGGAVICVLFFILWRILVWVMKWVDKQAEQHAAERKEWKTTQDYNNKVLEKITAAIDRHDEKAEERGRYVREEHKQMIEVLGRINGFKTEIPH